MTAEKWRKPLRYSGPKSGAFWQRVNSLDNEVEAAVMYALGCELQAMEEHVLRRLWQAERLPAQIGGSEG